MRDNRYKALHRGGPLSLDHHRLLAVWAAACAEHVLALFAAQRPGDIRPRQAIDTARAWARGECSVGSARAARLAARAAGHAVATAHMADHAPGAAMYAIRAVQAAAGHADEKVVAQQEHAWQREQLPPEIRDLVLSTFETKFSFLKLNKDGLIDSVPQWHIHTIHLGKFSRSTDRKNQENTYKGQIDSSYE